MIFPSVEYSSFILHDNPLFVHPHILHSASLSGGYIIFPTSHKTILRFSLELINFFERKNNTNLYNLLKPNL